MDSQDSTEVEWGSSRQPSISLKEWDIPMEDLKIGPKIGSGQFSTGLLVFIIYYLDNILMRIFCDLILPPVSYYVITVL